MDDLEAPDDDEFFYHEVPGWRVVDAASGALLARVVRVVETYAPMLEVAPAGGGPSYFIPVVGELIQTIDRATQTFSVDLPDGLAPP